PETYLQDPVLLERVRRLAAIERAALAELIAGDQKVHVAYLVARERAAAATATIAPELIPVLREGDGVTLARGLKPGEPLKIVFGRAKLSFPLAWRAWARLS